MITEGKHIRARRYIMFLRLAHGPRIKNNILTRLCRNMCIIFNVGELQFKRSINFYTPRVQEPNKLTIIKSGPPRRRRDRRGLFRRRRIIHIVIVTVAQSRHDLCSPLNRQNGIRIRSSRDKNTCLPSETDSHQYAEAYLFCVFHYFSSRAWVRHKTKIRRFDTFQ